MSDERPNILWICTDQQRFDSLGCYGNEFVETPHIDQLADSGVQFNHAYSQSTVCMPSRASFLTGRYPRTTGCRQNGQNIPRDEVLITHRLAESGYYCGLAGKLHVSIADGREVPSTETEPSRRVSDGYSDFHWSGWPEVGEHQDWLQERDIESRPPDVDHGDPSYERSSFQGSKYVQIGLPAEHHQTTWCAQKAINFIHRRASSDDPWLFSVNPFDPHQAFDPPEAYLDRYLNRLDEIPLPNYEDGELTDKPEFQVIQHRGEDSIYDAQSMDDSDHRLIRAAYYAMIDLIDDQVGRMLGALDSTDQRRDTIVVFMSDHGEMLGDHGIYRKGPQFYDPAVRVPLIISGPDPIVEGRKSDTFVELLDLAPTLLDAADTDHHPGIQGTSIWPILTGSVDEHRKDVYAEFYNARPYDEGDADAGDVAYNENLSRKPVNRPSRTANATMLRTRNYKLVVVHGLETGELYDLTEDPREIKNRWGDPEYRTVKVELLNRLSDRMAWTVDPLPERQGGY